LLFAVVCVAGLGGGQTGDYKTPAQSSYNVAASPYWGVEGVYASNIDPWQNWDNRQFMQNYYQLTTEYAKRGGISYPVSFASSAACVVHCCRVVSLLFCTVA
jgi:hypothetical protein